jgi:hypothetical protein
MNLTHGAATREVGTTKKTACFVEYGRERMRRQVVVDVHLWKIHALALHPLKAARKELGYASKGR